MLKLGLIGKGISRSQSARLHVLLGRMCGMDVSYDYLDSDQIEDFDLIKQLTTCAETGYAGVNVTHPYKTSARKLVTPRKRLPAALGAVNTVVFREDGWRGDNTDFVGFMRGYKKQFGDAKPGTVLQLGAGGVGLATAFGLRGLGADKILVHDKDIARGEELVATLTAADVQAEFVGAENLSDAVRSADGLINCTPIGMNQYPGCPFDVDLLGGQKWAFDAVYTPVETAFLRTATKSGIEVMTGFELFFFQGIEAFEVFSGAEIDADAARQDYFNAYPEALTG
ncbi:shikimate dehydrogenase [Thalassospira sp. GB04J01]|uniref:shikimate dehydrogenase family protein n=1 Tax=Thalassospira sp. GB04J01 TaxID=1485225 RepID=UPI000C9A076A|nr:shikimate dehydrogenase [Thalassospira sp. GB04J01]|tara:strand:- start:4738 stop:5586 length:849 start_codon:yes stop_codon:yes gene_type:complete